MNIWQLKEIEIGINAINKLAVEDNHFPIQIVTNHPSVKKELQKHLVKVFGIYGYNRFFDDYDWQAGRSLNLKVFEIVSVQETIEKPGNKNTNHKMVVRANSIKIVLYKLAKEELKNKFGLKVRMLN